MKRTTRVMATMGISLGLAIGGAGVAQASMNWGTLTVRADGSDQGQGYGTVSHSGKTAKLTSILRDENDGHGRTYASAKAYAKAPNFEMQSGRRADGESTFSQMAVKTHKNSVDMSGFRAQLKICQDLPGQFDECSDVQYGWF